MAYLPVPHIFQNATSTLPLSQLDTDLRYVSAKTLSVKDFGALGNNVADDYPAILAAITAAQVLGAGTRLYFPTGKYRHSLPIVISGTPIQMWGDGSSSLGAFGSIPAAVGSELIYTGPAGASVIQVQFALCQGSNGIKGMMLNGGGLAGIGLDVNCVLSGIYEDLLIYNNTKRGLSVRSTLGGPTCSFNAFRNIYIDQSIAGGLSALYVNGQGSPSSNACHNMFQDFRIGHADTATGLDLGACDNNRFIGFFMFRVPGGSGAGVSVIPTELAGFPVSNVFFHLQAGDGGWVQPVGTVGWNMIYGYMLDNGQPAPVTNNTPLLWVDSYGGQNTFLSVPSALGGGGDVRTAMDVRNPGGAIIIGYQGTGSSFLDQTTLQIRDAALAIIAQFTTALSSFVGRITASGRVDVGSGVGNLFAKAVAALGVGVDLDTATAGSGLYVVRNLTSGGTSVLNVDMAGTVTVVSDPAARIAVGGDPGPGAGVYWATVTGTTFRLRNRFIAAQDTAVCCVTIYGTPV